MNDATLDRLLDTWTRTGAAVGLGADLAARLVWKAIIQQVVPRGVDRERIGTWFGLDANLPPDLVDDIRTTSLPVNRLGAAFERTAHQRLAEIAKRDAGMYFTPAELADFSVERTVVALRSSGTRAQDWRVLDPAAGAGAFACALIEHLAGELPEEYVLTQVVRLVDIDPLAVAVARGLLVARFGSPSTDLDLIESHIICGDSVISGPYPNAALAGFDWGKQFPDVMANGGFSAVIGNPPWGAIKPAIREYAAAVAPELLMLDTNDMRSALGTLQAARTQVSASQERRLYATTLRQSGYVLQGKGDAEFYKFFVELAHSLVRPGGVIGMLIPSAFQRAAGAAELRKRLLDDGSFDLWLDFINSRGLFNIHRMFRFSLAVWRQGVSRGISRISFGLLSVEGARRALDSAPVLLSSDYLASVSPTRRTIPEVRTRDEADLYARLHRLFPPLEQRAGPAEWNVRFRREADMTNNARLFIPRLRAINEGATRRPDGAWEHPDRGVLLPLYEGRMVHQFDAAAKVHIDGHGRSAKWSVLPPSQRQIQPRYLIAETDAAARGVPRRMRAAFCDITGHANERTVLAAMVPSIAVCGNKVPTCEFDTEDPDVAFVWLALANSFVIDWIARRRVSTTLNFFHWKELPFARVDPASDVGRVLADAGRRLTASPGRPWSVDMTERARLRAEIDATVAQLYELDLLDMALVLQDFPLLDRTVAAACHRTVTRDLVLGALAAKRGEPDADLTDLGLNSASVEPSKIVERVEWHASEGAVAFVPGEHVPMTAMSA